MVLVLTIFDGVYLLLTQSWFKIAIKLLCYVVFI